MTNINFAITSDQPVSKLFLEKKIASFAEACAFITDLPFGRNKNKNDLCTVFTEGCGTCSTKHALLKQLAFENNADEIQLQLGLFKMTSQNTPQVSATLGKYGLDHIPEAHNYLRVGEKIIDCTNRGFSKQSFVPDLLIEIEIGPGQISDFKVNYHRAFLKDWLLKNPSVKYDFDELWTIREKCIEDLSN